MAKKKSAVPDDLLYKGFTMACPERTNGKHIRAINAPVRCKADGKNWPNHCDYCGWRLSVTKRRITKMVGEKMALKLIAQSEELAVKTRKEINEGKYEYC